MLLHLLFLFLYLIQIKLVFAFNNAHLTQNMVEEGRSKYQYLQQMSELPNYGSCWRGAVEHVENGCKALSEDMQSKIALHITNCFLDMSGHDTYHCEHDKKPNLRKICIASMTDRAFNVYTEFFTHTQNICWFLKGQVWYETMTENTQRVSKQLEEFAENQIHILESQKASLLLQENLLQYSQDVEKVMRDFHKSTHLYQETLMVVSKSLGNLQSWLIGELSWFDMVVFYTASAFLACILTSSHCTYSARFPILCFLIINSVIERLIYTSLTSNTLENDIHLLHTDIYKYIWLCRKICITFAFTLLVYTAFTFKDFQQLNHTLLQNIHEQNVKILRAIENEGIFLSPFEKTNLSVLNNNMSTLTVADEKICTLSETKDQVTPQKDIFNKKSQANYRRSSPYLEHHNREKLCKYNLRSHSSTPLIDV